VHAALGHGRLCPSGAGGRESMPARRRGEERLLSYATELAEKRLVRANNDS
jgi:hypothetical protein